MNGKSMMRWWGLAVETHVHSLCSPSVKMFCDGGDLSRVIDRISIDLAAGAPGLPLLAIERR